QLSCILYNLPLFDRLHVFLGDPSALLQVRLPFSGSLTSGYSWQMPQGADMISLVFTSDFSMVYKGFNITYEVCKLLLFKILALRFYSISSGWLCTHDLLLVVS
ncbi:hypothetical protein BOX15_Mlig031475g1, partial [Macrostomum lignano]